MLQLGLQTETQLPHWSHRWPPPTAKSHTEDWRDWWLPLLVSGIGEVVSEVREGQWAEDKSEMGVVMGGGGSWYEAGPREGLV